MHTMHPRPECPREYDVGVGVDDNVIENIIIFMELPLNYIEPY